MTALSSPAAGLAQLFYVEDEDNDVLFMRRALTKAGIDVNFQTVCDGDKAVAFLGAEAPYTDRPVPDLILLDLNLPARSGFEVLEWLRKQPSLRAIPVVILSSSGRLEDRERAQLLGANDYLIKPTSPLRLVDVAAELWKRWLAPEAKALRPATIMPDAPGSKAAEASSIPETAPA